MNICMKCGNVYEQQNCGCDVRDREMVDRAGMAGISEAEARDTARIRDLVFEFESKYGFSHATAMLRVGVLALTVKRALAHGDQS